MASNFDLTRELETTNERTNYARLCRLLIEGGTKALRELFNRVHPPAQLATNLADANLQRTLKSLLSRKIVTQKQYRMVYPTPLGAVDSSNFDITLLMILLRNICNLKQPPTGWDNLPRPTDTSTAADVSRIKFYRNKLCHGQSAGVSDAHFNGFWGDVSEALVRLGARRCDVDRLKTDAMDSDLERRYTDEILEWASADAEAVDLFRNILKAVTAPDEEKLFCEDHNAHANLHCGWCNEFICSACSIVKHQSDRCMVTDIRDVARGLRKRIGLKLPVLEEKIAEIQNGLEEAEQISRSLEADFEEKSQAKEEVGGDETDEAAVAAKLNDQYEEITKDIKEETELLEQSAKDADHILRYFKSLRYVENDDKLMTEYRMAEAQIKEVAQIKTSFAVCYKSDPGIRYLYRAVFPDASSIKATRQPHELRTNDDVAFDVCVRNHKRSPVPGDCDELECYARDGEGRAIGVAVETLQGDDSTHRLTFRVEKWGEYEVGAKLLNQHIGGSPHKLTVPRPFKFTRVKYKRDPPMPFQRTGLFGPAPMIPVQPTLPEFMEFLNGPYSFVAINTVQGGIVVVDASSPPELHLFSQSLVHEKTVTISKRCKMYCIKPTCIAVSPHNTCIIGNEYTPLCKEHPVVEFDLNGRQVQAIGSGKLSSANGAAFNYTMGVLYVTEGKEHRLHMFQCEGGRFSYIKAVGGRGRGPGQFESPTSVATNGVGDVIVSDTGNGRVQVLSAEGGFLLQFGGGHGRELGKTLEPLAVATDGDDSVYVCEGDRVQKFSQSGEFLSCPLLRRDNFQSPQTIAVTKETPFKILVTDRETFCLKCYEYET